MNCETSYDTSLKPFNHDKNRGHWSSPMDFLYACIIHSYIAILVMPSLMLDDLGIYGLVPYFIVLASCVAPIVFLQSFLGQFSSTGFISVFRIAPLFKGIGYVSLAINLTTLTYYSISGAIPFFFFFNSLRPTLPWSCEGAKEWIEDFNETLTPCTDMHIQYELVAKNQTIVMVVPSYEFFKTHINPTYFHRSASDNPVGTFSWSLLMCTFVLWIMVGVVLTKPIETISRFIRYSCMTVIGILCILLLRLAFMPGVFVGISKIFADTGRKFSYLADAWAVIPLIALSALGPGWGSILTMASYNNFKTNIFKYSWLLCLAQFGIMFGLAVQGIFVRNYLQRSDPHLIHFQYLHHQWMQFLIAPSTLTFLEVPHFWSLIYFGMIILGALNLLIVQLFSVLTSLFDEFSKLRPLKKDVTMAMTACLAVFSTFFCSKNGIAFLELLAAFSIITQMVLNLFLILVILLIYGRERFQRDVKFMTSCTYPTWMVNIVRFISLPFLLLSWAGAMSFTLVLGFYNFFIMTSILATVLLPWFLIPGYCILKVLRTRGILSVRYRRILRPTDWYPVDPVYRDQYEVALSQSHQLTTAATE